MLWVLGHNKASANEDDLGAAQDFSLSALPGPESVPHGWARARVDRAEERAELMALVAGALGRGAPMTASGHLPTIAPRRLALETFTSRKDRQIFSGVTGKPIALEATVAAPARARASLTAFSTAGMDPVTPHSPDPLTPIGFFVEAVG